VYCLFCNFSSSDRSTRCYLSYVIINGFFAHYFILDHNLMCVYSIGLISVPLPVGDERHLVVPAGVLLVAIIGVGGGLFESLKRVLPISGHKTVQHPVIVIHASLAKATHFR